MKSKRGVTLVEVMLAGAITSLIMLSLLEGVIVSTKISHENSQLLAAEAYAWDTAWKWLNKPYDKLNASTTPMFYPNTAGYLVPSNECPMICRELTGADARLYVSVEALTGTTRPYRHGNYVEAKLIKVDVEWGPMGNRKCLNALRSNGAKSYSLPVQVYKCAIDRGVEE